MSALSPRQAVKMFAVSRTTLMKALENGTVSGAKDEAGRWQIDAAELGRVYQPRPAQKISTTRPKPDHLDQSEPAQNPTTNGDISTRLARAEAALDAEREKTALLERHLEDLRRMLPAPDANPVRRNRWWPW